MKLAARIVTALALLALAAPALPCGFDKGSTTTTTMTPAPSSSSATSGSVAKADKAKQVKGQKVKSPTAPKATASN